MNQLLREANRFPPEGILGVPPVPASQGIKIEEVMVKGRPIGRPRVGKAQIRKAETEAVKQPGLDSYFFMFFALLIV